MAAIIDKHNAASGLRGRLFVAGGSNVAFGVDSEMLSRDLSMPVVNLGLHGGLGLDFMLSELRSLVAADDIVILSPEYFLDRSGNYKLKRHTSRLFPLSSGFFSSDINQVLAIEIDRLKLRAKAFASPYLVYSLAGEAPPNRSKTDPEGSRSNFVYTRGGFNSYGDFVSHLDEADKEFTLVPFPKYVYWDGISELNKFASYAEGIGAHVFFAYPPHPKSVLVASSSDLARLQNDLMEDLSIEIINSPSEVAYDIDHFFDTVYHLNRIGRSARTKVLIEGLFESRSASEAIRQSNATTF